ncbi:MAG: DUF4097 family beta strand repeat-containing protein [Bacteroidota bacterium]
MSASRRRTLKRITVVTIGVLFVILGFRQLASSGIVRASESRTDHHVEVRVDREVDRRVASAATTDDVLFAEAFAVREGEQLRLDLTNERVEILPAKGLEATVTVRGRGDDAQREFERRRFSADYRSGVLTVRTDPPRGWRRGRTDAQFVVTVEIPSRFSASVDVASGAVQIDEISGDLSVDTGSGSIAVGSARGGRISLDTGSGSIRADRLDGDVEVNTGSGSIDIGTVNGRFEGDTGSGSISVAEADVSRFLADTGSGSVDARLLREADVDIDTGSGRVTLALPSSIGAEIELSGRPIRIDDALRFQGRQDRNGARGRLGSGGPEMEIETGSGGITLRAG